MDTGNFKTVLWDVAPTQIPQLPTDFVIQRVLSYGTIGLIVLSIKENGIDKVKEVFAGMKPTAISTKKYEYLKKYLLV